MNALPQTFLESSRLRFERMGDANLDGVLAIENEVYPFPWSRTVFQTSIAEGYECWVAYDQHDQMVGYFVLMKVVDEAHLLTVAVSGNLHGQGIGRKLMDRLIGMGREIGVESLLLEVRPSNLRAVELYECYGFKEIGRRKNYYQASNNTREDAIVMRLPL